MFLLHLGGHLTTCNSFNADRVFRWRCKAGRLSWRYASKGRPPEAIKAICLTLVLLFSLPLFADAIGAEKITARADVELIFSMRKAEWEAYAPRIADPKWKVRLKQMETGTGVMAFDPSTGMGLSIQPLYVDDKSPPAMLVVGSFYPKGRIPANLSELQRQIEQEAQRDLGDMYAVSARYVKMPPSLEGIELSVTRASTEK